MINIKSTVYGPTYCVQNLNSITLKLHYILKKCRTTSNWITNVANFETRTYLLLQNGWSNLLQCLLANLKFVWLNLITLGPSY